MTAYTADTRPRRLVRDNLPNAISWFRLFAAFPLFVLLLRDQRVAGGVLLAVLGLSDWCDGYAARSFGAVTAFGRKLDPTADRVVMILVGLGALVQGSIPRPLLILALIREIGLSAAVVYKFKKDGTVLKVSWCGKVGAFLLFVAFSLILVSHTADTPIRMAFWAIALIGIGCSWASVLGYYPVLRGNPPSQPAPYTDSKTAE